MSLLYITGMASKSTYHAAHVFVAGVRVFEHLNRRPPTLKDLSELLKMSEEELSLLSRKLVDQGIVTEIISGAECRYGVGDFTKIESLPKEGETPRMVDEISQFQSRQQSRLKELEKSLSGGGEKQKVFSELEKALKDPSSLQKKKNPLD